MKHLFIAGTAAVALVFTGTAFAANNSTTAGGGASSVVSTDFSSAKKKAKPHAGTKFCPPGQAKKPGRGSAFKC